MKYESYVEVDFSHDKPLIDGECQFCHKPLDSGTCCPACKTFLDKLAEKIDGPSAQP